MTETKPRRIIRWPAVHAMTGYSEVQTWRLEKAGKHPKRIKLAEGGRAVGWFEDEMIAHQAARDDARNIASTAA